MRATKAVIHLQHLRHNLQIIREHIGEEIAVCAAVKADGYGHGAVPVGEVALSAGASSLAVAFVEEAEQLRQRGIVSSILLLSLPLPEEMDSIVRNTITPLVADKESIERLARVSRKYEKGTGVHLKIDTGMGRIGCTPEQAASLAEAISDNSWLHLEGVCTHFPKADYSDQTFTRKQLDRFNTALQAIRNRGIDPGIIHAANSGAVLDCPYSYFDMVRPGILLYGYYPSRDQARPLPVKPVMELVTKIVFLKKVPPRTPISYGGTHITHRETVIATLPVGYGDGIPRLLSNKAEVLIKGKRYPIVGTICMDQIMVDMGPQPEVELYDPVTLFGPDPEGPSAEEYSSLIGTIPYEITTGIASRVPRVYRE